MYMQNCFLLQQFSCPFKCDIHDIFMYCSLFSILFFSFPPPLSSLSLSGVVTSILGVPVVNVSLGRSHTVVLTKFGTVYTFGSNQYGQCGRNYIPPSEGMDLYLYSTLHV